MSTMVEMFPAPVRCSGTAIGFKLCLGLFGGTTPFITTYLVARTSDDFIPAYTLMAAGLLSLLALYCSLFLCFVDLWSSSLLLYLLYLLSFILKSLEKLQDSYKSASTAVKNSKVCLVPGCLSTPGGYGRAKNIY